MDEWILFIIWLVIVMGVTIALRLAMTNLISAFTLGILSGCGWLIIMSRYHVSKCEYDLSIYDTIKTIIILLSGIFWVAWTTYQIFRDNKQRRCCYICRQRKDLDVPIVYYDVVQYDDPEIEDRRRLTSEYPEDISIHH